MNILYVGNFAEKGDPLGQCPNADYISDSFESFGHKVTRVDEGRVFPEDIIQSSKFHDLLLVEEGRLKGDHWSSKDGKNHIEGHFQKVLDAVDIPCVAWLTNIFFNVEPREIEVATNPVFKSDIVFSTDGGHQKEFEAAGVNHVLLRQGIYEPEAYIGEATYPTKAEIGFIGSVYENIWPYRKRLVDFLRDTYGERFEHFGQKSDIRHDDLNNLIATLKIVVGDSVRSPRYWSNRLYEMLGRGAFLIFPNVEGLNEEFIPYEHFVPYEYGDFAGLKKIIDYYLVHDEERERIKIAGFEHCKKHHTYQRRVREMLRILKERKII